MFQLLQKHFFELIVFTQQSVFIPSYFCTKCNKKFKTENTLTTHSNKCSVIPTRLPCNFCSKTFVNDTRLNAHLIKYHNDNYIDNNKEFVRNGIVFSLNENVVNPPDSLLNDFNLSICNKKSEYENIPMNISDLNNSIEISLSDSDRTNFKDSAKSFCQKHSTQFIISLLNINSLKNKFVDIVLGLYNNKAYLELPKQ